MIDTDMELQIIDEFIAPAIGLFLFFIIGYSLTKYYHEWKKRKTKNISKENN